MKSLSLKEMALFDLILGIVFLITALSAAIIPIYKYHSELHSFLDFGYLILIILVFEIIAFSVVLAVLLVWQNLLKVIYFYKSKINQLRN